MPISFLNDISFQEIKKYQENGFNYITEYGYNESSQSVSLFLANRLTFINDLFPIRRFTNIRKMDSIYVTE